ncbi:hypothetical protein, partial [Marinimicrococcus flavescens]|nr:hypothetical protein [Marinimicrococcus flavescens]
ALEAGSGMDDTAYGRWPEAMDDLAAGQRAEVRAILDGRSSETEVIAALEGRLVAERVGPRCGAADWCAGGGPAGCGGCTAGAAAGPATR